MGTKQRREAAKRVKRMRDQGSTWAEVVEAVGVSESTGRKLLRELEADLERNGGRAARVEPPAEPAPAPEPEAPADAPVVEAPKRPAGPRSGRYLKLVCPCGHIVRASRTVADAGLTCAACGELYEVAA